MSDELGFGLAMRLAFWTAVAAVVLAAGGGVLGGWLLWGAL